jgi:hypothetical protein
MQPTWAEMEPLVRSWQRVGLITAEQATAIATYENDLDPTRPRRQPRTVPPLVEVFVYLGGVAAVTATMPMSANADLSTTYRVSVVGVVALLCLAGGFVTHHLGTRDTQRLAVFLFGLALAPIAIAAAVFTSGGTESRSLTFAMAMLMAATVAVIGWAVTRSGVQVVLLHLAIIAAIVGGLLELDPGGPGSLGLLLISLGLATLLLTAIGILTPRLPSEVMSLLTLLAGSSLLAPMLGAWSQPVAPLAMLVAGVVLQRPLYTGFGVVGMLLSVPMLLLDESMSAVAIAVIVAGLAIAIAAVAITARGRNGTARTAAPGQA